MEIIKPNKKLNIDKVTLGQPKPLRGGSYFTKILNNGKPLFIQLSSCKTKQGIVETGKKIYTDLMFSSENNEDVEFIDWIENLEELCHKLIFNKKDIWFHDNEQLDLTDIEGAFSSPLRLYKSGRYYLLRVKINKSLGNKQTCMVYDEKETILSLKDITKDSTIVTLLCFEGIRFSSRSFQLDITLKQVMIMDEKEPLLMNNCMIKINDNAKYLEKVNNHYDVVENSEKDNDLMEKETSISHEENVASDQIVKDEVNVAHEENEVVENNAEDEENVVVEENVAHKEEESEN